MHLYMLIMWVWWNGPHYIPHNQNNLSYDDCDRIGKEFVDTYKSQQWNGEPNYQCIMITK